ncbi:hypothetical protein TYRP_013054 [Tyrophagus putrescentiae]|nr:hypothetical protein TYRP_013054 [Tyrophagus putrescentiae]
MLLLTSVQIRFTICDPVREEDIILIRDRRQLLTNCQTGRSVDDETKESAKENLQCETCKTLQFVHLNLRQPCDYCSLMYFVLHFVKLPQYRARVISTVQSALNGGGGDQLKEPSEVPLSSATREVQAVLHFTVPNCDVYTPVDKCWSQEMSKLAVLRMEIEEGLSWLSTLGGACSSLGDRSVHFARRAGAISLDQLRLSLAIGDPNLIARCCIYISHSLCQQGQRRRAVRFVRQCLYPRLVALGDKCDRIVGQMYRALHFRMLHVYR